MSEDNIFWGIMTNYVISKIQQKIDMVFRTHAMSVFLRLSVLLILAISVVQGQSKYTTFNKHFIMYLA